MRLKKLKTQNKRVTKQHLNESNTKQYNLISKIDNKIKRKRGRQVEGLGRDPNRAGWRQADINILGPHKLPPPIPTITKEIIQIRSNTKIYLPCLEIAFQALST